VDGNRLNYGLMGRADWGAFEFRAAHLRYADPLVRFAPESAGFGTSVESQVRLGRRVLLDASYWQAKNFLAPLGQGLFQSRNPEDASAWYAANRRLVGLSVGWEGQSSLRVRAWYDLVDQSIQPSVTWVRYVVLDPL
jgi:hypothetical protein